LRIAFGGPARDHRFMTNHYHAVVWIDHKVARILQFNAEASETVLVHSTHPNPHLHHKSNSIDSGHAPVDKKYLERVAAAIAHNGALLIVGPASAKTELVSHLKQAHPAVAARISAVEPMDHPTDGQLLAHARRFFEADDRMRSQAHR
jgi:stalled ribosome rescue protein Dom34